MLLQALREGADMSFHDEFVLAAIIGAVAGLFFAAISRDRRPRERDDYDEGADDYDYDDWCDW